jgi:hypothetical protein
MGEYVMKKSTLLELEHYARINRDKVLDIYHTDAKISNARTVKLKASEYTTTKEFVDFCKKCREIRFCTPPCEITVCFVFDNTKEEHGSSRELTLDDLHRYYVDYGGQISLTKRKVTVELGLIQDEIGSLFELSKNLDGYEVEVSFKA